MGKKSTAIFILILALLLCEGIFSQHFSNPIITDRPDITESALTVPLNSLQIEMGFAVRNNSETIYDFKKNIRELSVLETLLRFGLFSEVELRLGTEYLFQKTATPENNLKHHGINGMLLGSKIQLFRDDLSFPDAALFFHFHLPVGSEHFKSEIVEPEILISASHEIGMPFSVSYNLGCNWMSGEEQINYLYSTSLGIEFLKCTGAFVELFGESLSAKSISVNLDTGVTYFLEENLQADISGGFNFDNPEDNWYLSTGLSLRFPE